MKIILESKVCSQCGVSKPIDLFRTRKVKDKLYYRKECKVCWNKYRTTRSPEGQKRKDTRNCELTKARRKLTEKAYLFITTDAKRSDKKRGRDFDLDKDFVRLLVSQPCCYCGETELRMTLDRKDNFIGHLKSNVVPACIRCNYTRRNIPYDAWLVIAKGMKEAREAGLFGEWTGRVR